MDNFTLGKLEITVTQEGNTAKFNWNGVSENKDLIPFLEPYYMGILGKEKLQKAILDFRTLKSMNSSTVPAIIDWVKKFGEGGVETKVYYNKTSNWQKTSFRLLGTISANMKNVTVEAMEG